jgi:hypothetical protein
MDVVLRLVDVRDQAGDRAVVVYQQLNGVLRRQDPSVPVVA